MEGKKFPNDFSLEQFCETFISKAIETTSLGLDSEHFDEKVFGDVASEMRIPHEAVKHLHHSLYWALFPKVLVAYQKKPADREQYIRLIRRLSEPQIKDYAKRILDEQRSYLQARVSRFNELAEAA
ncbi:MAG: hypothetical protein NT076_00575 [Candidatus Pacearchaeota archaeon]|nr:hypothetical protein [Candidatus Pacearchaeota archaeon]